MSGPGVDYEHRLGNDIYERTDGELVPLGAGYTSLHGSPVDLLIDDGEAVHAFELKNTSKNAYTLNWDPDDYQRDDLYYLMKFCVNYPRPTYPYWGIRFTNRQLVTGRLYVNDFPDTYSVLDNAVKLSPISCKRTYADNLRVHKPGTDEWPSQKLGDDVQHVLDAIGYVF